MASTSGIDRTAGPSRQYSQPRLYDNVETTEDMQELENYWEQMGNKIIQRINETPGATSRFHRGDVIKYDNVREREKLYQLLFDGANRHRGIYFAISDHTDHFHVIHDCNNGGGSCR